MVTPVLLVAAVVAAISMAAVPARSHMARTADIGAAENVLAELVAMNEADAARVEALRTDDEVEHLARRDFGLAKPGEEIYHVLAPAVAPPRVPVGWPFNHLGLRLVME
jgi:cell division protein FtsB